MRNVGAETIKALLYRPNYPIGSQSSLGVRNDDSHLSLNPIFTSPTLKLITNQFRQRFPLLNVLAIRHARVALNTQANELLSRSLRPSFTSFTGEIPGLHRRPRAVRTTED